MYNALSIQDLLEKADRHLEQARKPENAGENALIDLRKYRRICSFLERLGESPLTHDQELKASIEKLRLKNLSLFAAQRFDELWQNDLAGGEQLSLIYDLEGFIKKHEDDLDIDSDWKKKIAQLSAYAYVEEYGSAEQIKESFDSYLHAYEGSTRNFQRAVDVIGESYQSGDMSAEDYDEFLAELQGILDGTLKKVQKQARQVLKEQFDIAANPENHGQTAKKALDKAEKIFRHNKLDKKDLDKLLKKNAETLSPNGAEVKVSPNSAPNQLIMVVGEEAAAKQMQEQFDRNKHTVLLEAYQTAHEQFEFRQRLSYIFDLAEAGSPENPELREHLQDVVATFDEDTRYTAYGLDDIIDDGFARMDKVRDDYGL